MKTSSISSLSPYSVKKIGLSFAAFFIILEIVAFITDTTDEINIRILNSYILILLTIAIVSKEKIDDERSQKIRYFTLKSAFTLLLYSIILNYLLEFNIETIYLGIFWAIAYLIIFKIADYFNPEFIFTEETSQNKKSIKIFVGILIFMGIAFSVDILTTIISA